MLNFPVRIAGEQQAWGLVCHEIIIAEKAVLRCHGRSRHRRRELSAEGAACGK